MATMMCIGILFATSLNSLIAQNTKNMDTTNSENTIFPKGNKASEKYFSGDAFVYHFINKNDDENYNIASSSVTFEPGARTNWHSHPKGQLLLVTEGIGWYQEKGKPAQMIKKGDVVKVPANIIHWHGASSHSKLVHISITNYDGDINSTWLNPVTDSEYNAVNQ